MLVSLKLIMILLVLFQLKHWAADYPLQRPWMLGKFLTKGWVLPLAAHSGVHGLMTLAILGAFGHWNLWYLAVFDFVCHFIMDRIKASPALLGRFKALSPHDYREARMIVDGFPIGDIPDDDSGAVSAIKQARAKLRSNSWFWYALGIDQGVHHLTHYVVIAMMLCHG